MAEPRHSAQPPTPTIVAWPSLDRVEDLTRLQRLVDWNLEPWRKSTGGHVHIPRRATRESAARLKAADAVLLWNQAEAIGLSQAVLRKGLAVDPLMDISATDTLNRWVAGELGEADRARAQWEASRQALREFADGRTPLLIGSGPQSEDQRNLAGRGAHLPIILGTAMFDTDLLDALPPAILVCADGAGQLGGTPAAQALIEIIRQQLRRGAHLVVPEELGPIARHALGSDLVSRIHSVPISAESGDTARDLWRVGEADALGNVLTTLGLPVAAAMIDPPGNPDKIRRINTMGVGYSPDFFAPQTAQPPFAKTHWTYGRKSTLLRQKSCDLLFQEPGSILPIENYAERHYTNLSAMMGRLRADGIVVAPLGHPSGRPSDSPSENSPESLVVEPGEARSAPAHGPNLYRALMSRAVRGLEWLEAARHKVGMAALILSVGLLWAAATAPVHYAALGLATLAVIISVATALFLRLRVRRWQHRFERRRRLMDARAVELLSDRLAALEQGRQPPR